MLRPISSPTSTQPPGSLTPTLIFEHPHPGVFSAGGRPTGATSPRRAGTASSSLTPPSAGRATSPSSTAITCSPSTAPASALLPTSRPECEQGGGGGGGKECGPSGVGMWGLSVRREGEGVSRQGGAWDFLHTAPLVWSGLAAWAALSILPTCSIVPPPPPHFPTLVCAAPHLAPPTGLTAIMASTCPPPRMCSWPTSHTAWPASMTSRCSTSRCVCVLRGEEEEGRGGCPPAGNDVACFHDLTVFTVIRPWGGGEGSKRATRGGAQE